MQELIFFFGKYLIWI